MLITILSENFKAVKQLEYMTLIAGKFSGIGSKSMNMYC